MKFILVALAVVACASALTLFDRTLDGQWEEYKKFYTKIYANSREEAYRYVQLRPYKII